MISDGAEGLVDAQTRLQERMDELEEARAAARAPRVKDPERASRVESYRLARIALERQLESAHPRRRPAIVEAIAEVERRLAVEQAG